ncbi:hypothetical protein HW555_013064 [Spodoptera exigua]|uniref:Uncharacterized protein n=1 Tax=Spodoptera exigua TaxID=7107 RepID=A0A835G5U4_SPOEX|nr:hypothetical protein HW555_013064 [Spodoptera exigua]
MGKKKTNYEQKRTIDTDVAAIMLGHMHRLNDESQVWMLTGTGNNLSFICYLYNVENINDVDAARLQIFIDSYTVSDVNEAFNRKKLRNFDASSLPPCKSELLQQFLRENYICCIWNNAHLKNPTTYEPVNNGWILENDEYHFKWFEGDQLPNYVSESLKTVSEAGEEDDVDNDEFREWSTNCINFIQLNFSKKLEKMLLKNSELKTVDAHLKIDIERARRNFGRKLVWERESDRIASLFEKDRIHLANGNVYDSNSQTPPGFVHNVLVQSLEKDLQCIGLMALVAYTSFEPKTDGPFE